MNAATQYLVTNQPAAQAAVASKKPSPSELQRLVQRFEAASRQAARPVIGGKELTPAEAATVASLMRLSEEMHYMLLEVLPYIEVAVEDPLYKRNRVKQVHTRLRNLITVSEMALPT